MRIADVQTRIAGNTWKDRVCVRVASDDGVVSERRDEAVVDPS